MNLAQRTAQLAGTCLAVNGPEDDHLLFVDRDTGTLQGITAFIASTGALDAVTEWSILMAFEREGTDWDDEHLAEARAEYRARTGRRHPPLLRVAIRAEVEEASAEETTRYWEAERARVAEVPREDKGAR